MPDHLTPIFAALADPTRRAIVARLAQGEASVGELAAPFEELTVRAISKHIGVLEKAGLVTRRQDSQRRPSRLQLAPLRQVDDWLGPYRRLWDERFNRMETVIDRIKKGEIE
jgi:DNA-binding transcriptional ArsR family regulator